MNYKEAKQSIRAIMETLVDDGEYETLPFDEKTITQMMHEIREDQEYEEMQKEDWL